MEFHQLETFVRVAEYRSFSKAAESLFLTQPTISAHIISLEKELDIKLFDRRGKDIELTPAGRIMYERAKNILAAKEMALMDLKRFLGTVEGDLELYASSIPAAYILPSIIREFNRAYPGVVLKIRQADSGEVIGLVSEGVVELGIAGTVSDSENLEFVPFSSDELVLITPYNWSRALGNDNCVNIADFLHERFILREKKSGTRKTFETALKNRGFRLEDINIVAELGSSEAVKQAVKEGVGVSVISKKAVEDYEKMKLLRVYHIKDLDVHRSFYLVFKKGRTLSPNAATFKDFILNLKL
ncbi:selenium metabolism-associated LysR family transcriptional regulator [Thermosediminibacter litoriperuensis]|uniref:DNA-binding transcriptional LysR family regulator n=1 Tax=Thermosediminibacter litoriperuensis TaxID=291989 RepID=A0A5S5AYD9_9FIRM|nr:selenium metabolism-associated LysR family transcriptional regulator [Thermosediminibacter litoriperuensis]TYP58491.1 DNA-binding transcriptional LysR family regulator [Thermosediminibacter litoriperuensis]